MDALGEVLCLAIGHGFGTLSSTGLHLALWRCSPLWKPYLILASSSVLEKHRLLQVRSRKWSVQLGPDKRQRQAVPLRALQRKRGCRWAIGTQKSNARWATAAQPWPTRHGCCTSTQGQFVPLA